MSHDLIAARNYTTAMVKNTVDEKKYDGFFGKIVKLLREKLGLNYTDLSKESKQIKVANMMWGIYVQVKKEYPDITSEKFADMFGEALKKCPSIRFKKQNTEIAATKQFGLGFMFHEEMYSNRKAKSTPPENPTPSKEEIEANFIDNLNRSLFDPQ